MPPEPRWPAILAMLVVASLRYALPPGLRVGPDWLMLALVPALLVPVIYFHRTGHEHHNRLFGLIVTGLVTLDTAISLALLISRLPEKKDSPQDLLIAAAGLWSANVLIFASWYWRLDAGGPHARDRRDSHDQGAFLFPQMTLDDDQRDSWKPGFVDYLFLAFNASTAFSPTDAPVLSRWAKVLMMLQSSISLGTLAIVAARAINVL